MKKIFALLSTITMMTVLVGPVHAQSSQTESVDFLEAARRLASLENYNTTETLRGEIDTDFVDVIFELNTKNRLANEEGYSVNSVLDGFIEVQMDEEAYGFNNDDFKTIRLQGAAELIGMGMDESYIKLDDLEVQFQGSDAQMGKELLNMTEQLQSITGNWYSLGSLEESQFLRTDFDQLAFLTDFKMNPEEAIQNLIETQVEKIEKDSQFYDDLYATRLDYIDPFSVDYQTYLDDDSVEKTKVDKDILEEKGALICHYFPELDEEILMEEVEIDLVPEPELKKELEDELPQELPMKGDEIDMEMIEGFDIEEIEEINLEEELMKKPESFENGFQRMHCFPNEKYEGELTEVEQGIIKLIEQRGGEWLYVDGDWYFVEVYPYYPNFEEQQALKESFDYDDTAIAAKVAHARQAVQLFFDTDLFRHKVVDRGNHAGYQFFSLDHNRVASLIYQISYLMGDSPTFVDYEDMLYEIRKMRLGGLYHVNDAGLLDDLMARFKMTEKGFVDATIHYHYTLDDAEANNQITAPTDVKAIDTLIEQLEDL